MPHPKLSPVLNNCPLHALTPEIKAEILKFSDDAQYNNHHNAQYLELKHDFATFYGFNPDTCSWRQFAGILNRYNEFDTQIILGPVLRLFMKRSLRTNENTPILAAVDDIDIDNYINQQTEINPQTSRYISLSPDELAEHVAKPLGLSLSYHPQEGATKHLDAENPITTVNIYHQGDIRGAQAGGHWERTKNGEQSIDYQPDSKLQTICELFSNDDPRTNPYALLYLKQHVRLSARAFNEHNELAEDFDNIIQKAQRIGELHFGIVGDVVVPNELSDELAQQMEVLDLSERREAFSSSRHTDSNHYSFLLKAGATFAAVLSMAAFVVAALALTAIISIATIGVGALLIGGAVAGLASYGLLKKSSNSTPNPDEEPLDFGKN